jgi:splicing factor 3A subunit 3
LGIKNSGLFREITGIDEALLLARKLERDKEEKTSKKEDVIEMEDSLGNVMPEKVYNDLAKQGIV